VPSRSLARCAACLSFTLVTLLVLAGCAEEQVETAPPGDWQADGARWWVPGADTARAFRDLSSVGAMGVSEKKPVFGLGGAPTDEQVAHAAKKELKRLYRKAPEIVDSLFGEYVAPQIESVPRSGDMQEKIRRFGETSHETIREHFYPSAQLSTLGTDVPLGYPDSLFKKGVSGSVYMQVYVDKEGRPRAIKLIDSLHPVLDDTARRAVAQARWEPARVRSGQYGWREIPSWTWLSVNFG
jgi:TonB family protein